MRNRQQLYVHIVAVKKVEKLNNGSIKPIRFENEYS